MINTKPIHLLIRFSDNLFKVGDVIYMHNEVINRQGAVWFGKLGTPIAQRHIDKINFQCKDGIPSFLFLVKGNRRKSTFFKAGVLFLSLDFPSEEQQLIPQYYFNKKITSQIKFWAKLSDISPLEPGELKMQKVAGSVLEINETLFRSSSGHFIVQERIIRS